ncbi:MAG: glycerol acyltransferase [Bacteroidales bacterium]|nr:glycerol acyltransferase [Bacteroidales bacterium]
MEEFNKAEDLQLIDIEKVFASKDEKLLKRIPGFLIRYLKRIVHQDEINNFLIKNEGLVGIPFAKKAVEYMDIDLTICGEENIPDSSRIIIVGNHPLGGLDGSLLTTTIHDKLDPGVKITSNDLLMNVRPMQPLFLGLNKHGGNSRSYVKDMHDTFDGNHAVIFFPAGLVSRRRKGIIEDMEWKRTFIKKAVMHKRDVLPVHFSGRVSNFFYMLANLRKLLGIKYNIEMLYLPNEMFKHRHQKITMTIGKPIPWQTFTKEKTALEWAQIVKARVYEFGKKA